jgi:hypothetical protein
VIAECNQGFWQILILISFASGHPGKNWFFCIDFGFSKLKEAFVLPDPGHASF